MVGVSRVQSVDTARDAQHAACMRDMTVRPFRWNLPIGENLILSASACPPRGLGSRPGGFLVWYAAATTDARLTFKRLLEIVPRVDRRPAKDELFAAFASAAKALGNGRRAEIIDVLAQGERSVDEIASEIGQSVANTSQHLQVLADAGLVRSRRAGARVFYSPASDRVVDLWTAVRDVASEHVATIEVLADAYLGDRSQVEHVGIAELSARLADGSVVLLDVRPRR